MRRLVIKTRKNKEKDPVTDAISYSANKEYDMVRNQIDNAIERMDKYNLQAITVLSAGALLQGKIGFSAVIISLLVSMFLVLKIFECRSMVTYNVTYMTEFIEGKESGLLYEKRFQGLRDFYKDEKKKDKTKRNINKAEKDNKECKKAENEERNDDKEPRKKENKDGKEPNFGFIKKVLIKVARLVVRFGYCLKYEVLAMLSSVVAFSYIYNTNIHLNTIKGCIKIVSISALLLVIFTFSIGFLFEKTIRDECVKDWQRVRDKTEC